MIILASALLISLISFVLNDPRREWMDLKSLAIILTNKVQERRWPDLALSEVL